MTRVAYNGQTAAPLTDAVLADYAAEPREVPGGHPGQRRPRRNLTNRNDTTSYLSALTDAEWATLDKFERTFGIRRMSDFTAPSPVHGLNVVGGISQDGKMGTLTAAGKARSRT